MIGLARDMRFAWRNLRATPAVSLVIILVLSQGIGAITALFAVTNALVLRPLAYKDPDQLVFAWEKSPESDRAQVSLSAWRDWNAGSSAFDGLAAFQQASLVLTGMGEPERVSVGRVSFHLFPVLGVQPALGRAFSRDDDIAGAAPVVVLAHGFWQRRFGGDPDALGRVVTLDDRRFIVIGVMASGFRFTPAFDAFVPLMPRASDESRAELLLTVIGRLARGVSVEQARGDIERITRTVARNHPSSERLSVIVEPMQEYLFRGPRADLPVLTAAAVFVLLIACSNVAGLLMAKGAARRGEMALKSALGASRSRLVRELSSESVLLAVAAGAGGTVLAHWATASMRRMIPPGVLANEPEFSIDSGVLLFVLMVSATTGIVFGLLPAWAGSRANLNATIGQASGRTRAAWVLKGAGRALITVEITLSVILLVGSGLMIRTFANLTRVAPVDRPEGVVVTRLSLPEGRYPTVNQRILFFRQVLARMEALPGARQAAVTTALPFRGSTGTARFELDSASPEDRGSLSAHVISVSEEYFEILGVGIKQGRGFAASDAPGSAPVAVVNESFARRLLHGHDVVGRRASMKLSRRDGQEPSAAVLDIVGVCGDLRTGLQPERFPPQVFVPYHQNPGLDAAILLRTDAAWPAIADALRGTVKAIDKDQPLTEVTNLRQMHDRSFSVGRILTSLMAAFGALALVLSLMGVYGLVSYSVTQRNREMAIRMALGARKDQVVRMVLRQGVTLMATGLGMGLLGAIGLALFMRGVLFGVAIHDPLLFGGVPLLLALVILAAIYLPARRAAACDPMSVLRFE